jgi:predicted O-methyltransferase YrrM
MMQQNPEDRKCEAPGASFSWDRLLSEMAVVRAGGFAELMEERRRELGTKSSMGGFDSTVLSAFVRMFAPRICVETGGNRGMTSAFILEGMRAAGVLRGVLYSVEVDPNCPVGILIPEDLKPGYKPMIGDVKQFMRDAAFPKAIDLFLHDSSHRYKYQMLEFRYFWKLLRPGGVLISHDVNMNASFVDFVSRTYRHDKIGQTDIEKTMHTSWGRIGNIGFMVKA